MYLIPFSIMTFCLLLIGEKGILPSVDKSKNTKNIFVIFKVLAIILLIAFPTFRDSTVGYDTPNYYKNFEIILVNKSIASPAHAFEIGYQIINLIGAVLFGKYGIYFVFAICFSIIVLSIVYSSKRLSYNNLLTMFLFITVEFYLRSFDQLRQGVAIAIIVFAFVFLLDRKPIAYCACVIVATLFHSSAIILLPLYFLNFVNTDKKQLIFFSIFMILAFLGGVLEDKIVVLMEYVNIPFISKQNLSLWVQDLTLVGVLEIIVFSLIFLFLLVFKFIVKRKGVKVSTRYDIFLNTFYMSIIVEIIAALCHKPHLYGRMIYYFFWAIVFLLPEILQYVKNDKIKWLLKLSFYCFGFGYLIVSIIINAYGIV